MKILFLTPGCFDKGGISRYSRYQIRALRELFGDENVRVLSLLGPSSDSFEEEFKVFYHTNGNIWWEQMKFVVQTTKQVIAWRPDIIHIAHVNFSGFAKVVASLCGAKTVLNIYGLEVWSGLSLDASYGLKKVDHVISDCHYTASFVEQESLRSKGSTFVIWDCVDLDRFYPAEPDPAIISKYNLPDPSVHFVVMALGRLSKAATHKGYDRLIWVFSLFARQNPNARLVIAGKGDHKDFYEQLVREAGIEKEVRFTGMIDEADLPALYRCASVFSLVSDRGNGRGEGIPLTPLEAMACGIPVIVGNHDGSQEAVQDNLNGTVIDPFNLEQHQLVLRELASSPALLQQKKEQAAILARSRFSYNSFREKHRLFYNQL